MAENDPDSAGYQKPPHSGRFKKGQSGNLKGRPKGSRNVNTILRVELNQKVVIHENGRRKTITKLEAVIKQMVNKAASGELGSIKHLIAIAQSFEQSHLHEDQVEEPLCELEQTVFDDLLRRLGSFNQENESGEIVSDDEKN